MEKWIDLRSDTVTQPTQAMRMVMMEAMVGDDVYGDDPTVLELESLAAKLTGKEAALFVPSGTFGNQLALFTHCQRGNEVILGEDCHIVAHEAGGAAIIAGVQLRTLETRNGKMDLDKVKRTIRIEEDIHFPRTKLICLENAYSNGSVLDLDYMKDIHALALKNEVKVHLDGARLFNAATYLGVEAKELTQYCDSVMFCLSKGLCAPVGSILAGDREFIQEARKKRKIMGGGLRQAGILAAAGLVSLKVMTGRLQEDHTNAKALASRLEELPGITVDKENLKINLVFFEMENCKKTPEEIVAAFYQNGIKVNGPENGKMRFATHYGVSKENIDTIIEVFKGILC